MFDNTAEVPVCVTSPSGDKEVLVRYPEDELLIERAGKIKVLRKFIGGGQVKTEVPNDIKVTANIYDRIFVSGPELDEYEKNDVVNRLCACQVTESTREAGVFQVILWTPMCSTVHNMRVPSSKNARQYQDFAQEVVGEGKQLRYTTNLKWIAQLYDELMVSVEGYTAGVPACHKSEIVTELIVKIDRLSSDHEVKGF